MQPKHENAHNRKQFQIDRVAFFSDAVIAIAITLMVLEIKIPPLGNISVKEAITKYYASFLVHASALFICFITIGNLWIKHHELYEHIINYNKALIKSNLYFLLAVVLLPISISFMFEEGSPMAIKLFIYFINLALCNLSYYFMLRVIFHNRNNFSAFEEKDIISKNKFATLFGSVVFTVIAVLGLMSVSWFYAPLFAFPAARLLRGRFARQTKNTKQPGITNSTE